MTTPLWADFRSDACTLPSAAMRQAMAKAEVGNDDFGEDPTIQNLERDCAALLGKPAALFVQSGTMGNLVCLMCHLERGDRLLTSRNFHIDYWEGDAVRRVIGADFDYLADDTQHAFTTLRLDAAPGTRCRVLSIETPVNRLGGTLLSLPHLQEIRAWAAERKLLVHCDGARFLNAAVALKVAPATLAECMDSVTVSFNKAVGAPAGAAVGGSEEFIARARRCRWMLGGAWKQGGILAAACLTGLVTWQLQIATDHRHAWALAEGLNAIPGLRVDLASVVTNLVMLRVENTDIDLNGLQASLSAAGVRIGRFKEGRVSRLVTHNGITGETIHRFLELMRRFFLPSPLAGEGRG